MATNPKTVFQCLGIMRVALGRRNVNDPDSSDNLFLQYLDDFATLTMTDDVKLFENFGTLSFIINSTHADGVYTFNDVGSGIQFSNISMEAFISILNPVGSSTSWNWLPIYQDPGEFFSIWGINNEDILLKGYPTMMLYYGNEFTFRTIPQENVQYQIKIFGYKINETFMETFDSTGAVLEPAAENIQFNYWLRYLAYGAALNYANDYRYQGEDLARIQRSFSRERKLLLTRTHNQVKMSRSLPQF